MYILVTGPPVLLLCGPEVSQLGFHLCQEGIAVLPLEAIRLGNADHQHHYLIPRVFWVCQSPSAQFIPPWKVVCLRIRDPSQESRKRSCPSAELKPAFTCTEEYYHTIPSARLQCFTVCP